MATDPGPFVASSIFNTPNVYNWLRETLLASSTQLIYDNMTGWPARDPNAITVSWVVPVGANFSIPPEMTVNDVLYDYNTNNTVAQDTITGHSVFDDVWTFSDSEVFV